MENVGTWNSDVALFYLIVFTFPLWICILIGMFSAMGGLVNFIDIDNVYIAVDPPKKKKKKQQKKKKNKITFEEYKEGKSAANKDLIFNDVVSALKRMGFKVSQSKSMVSMAFVKHPEGDFNTIFNECVKKK